jgi:hypothetical protein
MIPGFLGPYAFFALTLSAEHRWKRYLILALAGALVITFFLVPGPAEVLARPAMIVTAAVWIASGVITLLVYIRKTHPRGEGEVDGEE